MMQFNLLPDVKLAYIKAQRSERLAISISVIAVIAALVILGITLGLVGWQKKSLGDLNRDIKTYSNQIAGTQNLNKILTIQNQLNSLPALDAQKPEATLLSTYIRQLTPEQVYISDLKIDFTANTIQISGTANSLADVDQFVDTLKFATYTTTATGSTSKNVFSDVVLSSFSLAQQGSGNSYDITADFDPVIFNSSETVKINVPTKISTRSILEQPLFTGSGTGQ